MNLIGLLKKLTLNISKFIKAQRIVNSLCEKLFVCLITPLVLSPAFQMTSQWKLANESEFIFIYLYNNK